MTEQPDCCLFNRKRRRPAARCSARCCAGCTSAYGHKHRVGSAPDVATIDITTLVPPPPWTTTPVIRYGGDGERTQIVCGYLHSDDLLFNPVLGALPKLMHLRAGDTPLAQWVEASGRRA